MFKRKDKRTKAIKGMKNTLHTGRILLQDIRELNVIMQQAKINSENTK